MEMASKLPPENVDEESHLYFIKNLFRIESKKNESIKPVCGSNESISNSTSELNLSFLSNEEEIGQLCHFPDSDMERELVADIAKFADGLRDDVLNFHKELDQRDWKRGTALNKEQNQKEAVDKKIKNTLDKKVDNLLSRHSFYVKKTCPVAIPFKSTLSHQEHSFYIHAFVKFGIRPAVTATEKAEYNTYMNLQNRVFQEQSQFMNFSFSVASMQLSSYNMVPDVVTNYINEYCRCRREMTLKYDACYTTEQLVPIRPIDHNNQFHQLSFSHEGHLLSLGFVPTLWFPNVHKKESLPIDEKVSELKPPSHDDTLRKMAKLLYKVPVSCDTNAEYLAQKHRANIVVSSSALKVLVDNHEPNFDKEWDIPVRIKSYDITDETGHKCSHRVVYIDKPLPKKVWTPLEKKQLFFKKAALMTLIKPCKSKEAGMGFRLKQPDVFCHNELKKLKSPIKFKDEPSMEAVGNLVPHIKCADNSKRSVDYSDCCFGDESVTANYELFGCDPQTSPSKKKFAGTSSLKQLGASTPKRCKTNKSVLIETKKNALKTQAIYEQEKNLQNSTQNHPSNKVLSNAKCSSNYPVTRSKKAVSVSSPVSLESQCVISGPDASSSSFVSKIVTACPPPITLSSQNMKLSSKPDTAEHNHKCPEGILENIMEAQDIFLKESNTIAANWSKSSDDQLDGMPWSVNLPTDWSEHKQPLICPESNGSNVHYELFSFGYGTNAQLPGLTRSDLKIIVRHNVHGISSSKSKADKKSDVPMRGKRCAHILFPKLENQPYFGCEVFTLSEVTKKWIHLLCRPNVTLVTVRVCEMDGEILMVDEHSLNDIIKSGKQSHINFSPHIPLAALNAIFSAVVRAPSGGYLLHHDAKSGAFVNLMKATKNESSSSGYTFNLHESYSKPSLTRNYSVAPWLAIDTHVLTPFHKRHLKIPATFPMNNPEKKLTKNQKKKIYEKMKKKKRLQMGDEQK